MWYKRESVSCCFFHSLYLAIFLFLQSNFLLQISQLLWETESSNFACSLRVAMYIVGQKTKLLRFILHSFSFFHLSLECNTKGEFLSNSSHLLHLGFCNLVQMLWMICCIMWKRTRLLLLILPLISSFFFLSNFKYKTNHLSSLKDWEAYKVESWSTHRQWAGTSCILESSCWCLVIPLLKFLQFFFLSISKTHISVRPTKLKLDKHMGNGLIYCVRKSTYLFFIFLLVSVSPISKH